MVVLLICMTILSWSTRLSKSLLQMFEPLNQGLLQAFEMSFDSVFFQMFEPKVHSPPHLFDLVIWMSSSHTWVLFWRYIFCSNVGALCNDFFKCLSCCLKVFFKRPKCYWLENRVSNVILCSYLTVSFNIWAVTLRFSQNVSVFI